MAKKPIAKTSVEKAAEAMANEVKASAAIKAAEAPKAVVKEEPKKDTVVEEKEVVKEETAKPAKKAAAKTTKKAATTKAVKEKVQPEVFVEFYGNQADVAALVEKVKGIYVADGHRESSIKSLQVYVKPEEYAAYYVINQKITGRVDLF